MKLAHVYLFILLGSYQLGYGQANYDVTNIPEEVLANANVIVRNREVHFAIESTSKATYHVLEAVTILNAKGRSHAVKAIYYDRLTKITQLRASLFSSNGSILKKYKASDFSDHSAISGFSLYEDNRVKVGDFTAPTYPYTLEIEYQLDFNFLFYIPPFYPVWDEHMSAQQASYKLTYPIENEPRFVLRNMDGARVESQQASGEHTWNFENINAFTLEKYGPHWTEITPTILAAPLIFEFEGYKGNMDTWENFGKWINQLNEGRDELPPATKIKVKELLQNQSSIEEKVSVLYEYLQNRTRYVSIQLGIGGFQPFDARTVDEVGYGDCKALSNYMIALLKEAGINSNYTLIRAGENAAPIDYDFPSTQFNHVIVSVPNGLDTLWLECTSQTNPFGYLGSFTSDRAALAITKQGGRIVKTPVHRGTNNKVQNLKVRINENGSSIIEGTTSYQGLYYERDEINNVADAGADRQKKWIAENFELPSFKINEFSFSKEVQGSPKVMVNFELMVDRLASVSGKRLFVTPNLMNKLPIYFQQDENRKQDIIVSRSIEEIDTIEFILPENLYPEFIPNERQLSSKFGEYQIRFELGQGRLLFIRKLILKKGRYLAEDYSLICDFNRDISKTDNTRIAFLNKT